MTTFIRKYYNQPIAFDHRRIWPQKEKQQRKLRKEDLQKPNLKQSQNLRQNQSQNLKQRKSHLVVMQLAFQADQKLLKKSLVKHLSHQVK